MTTLKSFLLLAALLLPAVAANVSAGEKAEKKGEAILTVFSNFHTGMGTVNHQRGFELDRAYLGYQYRLPKNLVLKVVADFGQSADVRDNHRIGYLKNAMVTWKHDRLTLNAGLIGTTQFKLQESFWGKRYLMKSFQDEYKFGSSADLAVSVAYKVAPFLSADAIVANGEGYKKVQVNDGLLYGAGLTFTPFKGLTLRTYASYNEGAEDGQKGVTNIACFAGYAAGRWSLAAEYNHQWNARHTAGNDKNGVSVYSTVRCSKTVNVFGRWDYVNSSGGWDAGNDGMAGVAGVEFRLGKYIRLSPNFRLWAPAQDHVKKTGYAYLNASFAL